ncbi:MAG: TIGR01459 family HAD-type hydrolase [Micavibrio sp.]|nr:TIGR01459 family HAD-type hydrolase [Micavibrio sp.]|tara:strand:+ start:236 stop:1102 length:867 start_codon:yes stop_codon:yes gene_type:complete
MISGITEIADKYDGFIFDVWGVLYNGVSLFDGVIPTLTYLKEQGKEVVLLTNSPRRAYNISNQLEERGLNKDLYKTIISSGELAFKALQARNDDFHTACGTACYYLGPEKFLHALTDSTEITIVDDLHSASFACVSHIEESTGDTAALIELQKQLLDKNIPLLCTNPDLTVRFGDHIKICGGTFAKEYQEMGGNVFFHGKPHRPCYEETQKALGITDKKRILAIGDSIKTDITGAKSYGIDALLNLPGVHWDEFLDTENDNRLCHTKLSAFIQEAAFKPDYIMNGITL